LDASYFVFENVKGLTVGKHRKFLEEIIEAFSLLGYSVRMPWRVLNASSYGVPQDRERFFLIGAKRGLPVPEYPNPITVPARSVQQQLGLPLGPTCGDAIGDLPDAEQFKELMDTDSAFTDRWTVPSEYASELRCMTPKSWHFGYPRNWEPRMLTSSMRTIHTEISRRRFSETAPGSVEPISRFFKLSPDGLSNTLRAGTDSARGAFTSPRPVHYKYPRCITVREMARLHGFPDWFRLHETKWHGARQVGNAVPPPLARAIAEKLIEALGIQPVKPAEVLDLGDPELLRIGMAQASAYWGIPVPIGRRDRKSGAKKRKQEEIEMQRIAAAGAKSYG
jgi:DNA (cytosine-5)-methyltransferase 1